MVHDGSKWHDFFLVNDYIGATWPWRPHGQNVGNGGFSLRSRQLLDALRDNEIQGEIEDTVICQDYRQLLEAKGIKFAPTELANKFSIEHRYIQPTFGFHGIWNAVRYFDNTDLKFISENWPDYINNCSKEHEWNSMLQQQGKTI
jgi:hypothetical protein